MLTYRKKRAYFCNWRNEKARKKKARD